MKVYTRIRLLWLGLLAAILLACQPALAPAEVFPTPNQVQQLAAAVTIAPTNTSTPLPVVVFDLNPTEDASAPPAMVLPAANELQTSTPIPTPTNTPDPTRTAVPTETPTPIPTFTPPSLPGTSANEHYWLRRPIADGGTVWTDKFYPYGSTRGGTLRPHHGVEFAVPSGTPVLASAAGTVVFAGSDAATMLGPEFNFYGNVVVIEHETKYIGQSVFTLYAHLSQVAVGAGQRVEALQTIALSGASGIADGAHLHFEVRLGCNQYSCTRNPLLWLWPFKDHGTIAGRIVRPNNILIEGFQISASRIDARSRYKGTTTYTGNTVNPDVGWGENFVIDDVVAGYYQINFKVGDTRYKEEFWVYPGQTAFVEFVVDAP